MSAARSPSIRPGCVFELRRDLASLDQGLRLRNIEWGVLFALTGEHTVAQIGDYLALEEFERDRVFERLLDSGLIAEPEPPSTAPTPPPPPPRSPSREVHDPPDLAQVTRAVPIVRQQTMAPSPPSAAPVAHDQLVPFEPLSAAPAKTASSRSPLSETTSNPAKAPRFSAEEPPMVKNFERRLSLKALMQFILERAQDSTVGQLDIYRVFIRVNTKLMRRNGIHTLRFEEDHLISDPELQNAILSSVQKTLGLSCPQSVFV